MAENQVERRVGIRDLSTKIDVMATSMQGKFNLLAEKIIHIENHLSRLNTYNKHCTEDRDKQLMAMVSLDSKISEVGGKLKTCQVEHKVVDTIKAAVFTRIIAVIAVVVSVSLLVVKLIPWLKER